jgi:drug/metabolite transporter (DMT)-like permease
MSPNAAISRATLLGLGAVLLWAVLAALTALAGTIPPFQLAAMTFAVGTAVGLIWTRVTGQTLVVLRDVPMGAWLLGVFGLLGFHVCYFFALQSAPVLVVSTIVYLWPLLIVLMTGLLPATAGGGPLRWWHLAGAALGFGGAALLLVDGAGRPEFVGSGAGVVAAFAAAIIWSSYSVASRLYARVPSIAVIGSCAATTLGAGVLHFALEATVLPTSAGAWLAVLGLGLGPVGLAFYLWDEGMKHGDIRLLGVASYATPLVSALILWALGLGTAGRMLWVAAILITVGALVASWDRLKRQ